MRWTLVIGAFLFVVWVISLNPDTRETATNIAPNDVKNSDDIVFDKPLEKNPPATPIVTNAKKAKLFVSGSRVNVRSGPGTSHAVIGQLSLGDTVTEISATAGWKEIETTLGNGWMSAKYLSPRKPEARQKIQSPSRKRQIALPTSREKQEARKS